jgi:hypothetical protein
MARHRQRRSGNRNKGGRPALPREPIVTNELLAHRQRAAPGIPMEDLMKQRAGVPLEILATMPSPEGSGPVIGEAMRQAGEQMADLVQRWRRLHQVPDGTRQKVVTGAGGEVDPRQVQMVNASMAEVQAALDKVSPIARAVTEAVCVDDYMGRCADRSLLGARLRVALREGLTALCQVFRVPAKRAA